MKLSQLKKNISPIAAAHREKKKETDSSVQRKENKTGLPDHLKSGIENLSGMDMGDVKVHYNSAKPAGLQAHAYAQGTDIHLAPGQERHLPHEAWHVVQQKQGRVKPTMQMKGKINVNDERGLEKEADVMGMQALNKTSNHTDVQDSPQNVVMTEQPIQRVLKIEDGSMGGYYETKGGKDTKELIAKIEKVTAGKLKRGWKGIVGHWAGKDKKVKFVDTVSFLTFLLKRFPPKLHEKKKKKIRPNFPKASYDLGRVTLGIQTGKDQSNFSPSDNDGALPHRFPYSAIQKSTEKYLKRTESSTDLIRWSDRLKVATEERLAINMKKLKDQGEKQSYQIKVAYQLGMFSTARNNLIKAVDGGQTLGLGSSAAQDFLKWTNALHGNIPDYGPHTKVNIPVSDRLHMHLESGRLTPGSHAAGSMTPTRTRGLAMTDDGESLVTTDGNAFDYDNLHQDDKNLLDRHQKSNTSLNAMDLDGHDF